MNYILICFGLFFLVVFFLLGDSPAPEFFSADISEHSVCHRSCEHVHTTCDRQSVPKRRHLKFRHQGITQKKEYNIHNTVQV